MTGRAFRYKIAQVQFKLIVPRDAKFVPALRQLAERVSQCAGYSAADAARVASAVGQVVEILFTRAAAQPSPGVNDSLDIRFERKDGFLDVWLRYAAEEQGPPAVDPSLSSEALRHGMDSAEFGREGDVQFCRLRRKLPTDKTDHQCDAPPLDPKP